MKCYYDPTQDAVGTCKSCGKGISTDYLTDMGKGLACRNRCEDDVKLLINLIQRNISSSSATNQILKKSAGAGYGSSAFMLMMGLIFTLQGISEPQLDFTLYLGVGFLLYGFWILVRSLRYSAVVAKLPEDNGPST